MTIDDEEEVYLEVLQPVRNRGQASAVRRRRDEPRSSRRVPKRCPDIRGCLVLPDPTKAESQKGRYFSRQINCVRLSVTVAE